MGVQNVISNSYIGVQNVTTGCNPEWIEAILIINNIGLTAFKKQTLSDEWKVLAIREW